MSKYGIFKANIFVKRPPLKMLDIIESDNYIGKPLEVFDTAEQAVSKMNEEYFSSIKKVHQYPRGHFYDCTAYFVSECVSMVMMLFLMCSILTSLKAQATAFSLRAFLSLKES